MKILIDNSNYALKNLGDVAMLVSAVKRINLFNSSAEVYIFTNSKERLSQYIPNAIALDQYGRSLWLQNRNLFGALHNIFPHSIQNKLLDIENILKNNFPFLCGKFIALRFRRRGIDPEPMFEYLRTIQRMDYVIATGGGFITNSFVLHAKGVLLTLELSQKFGKQTAIFGQGLGPLTDEGAIKISKRVFPKLKLVGLREGTYSYDLAIEMGACNNKVYVTGDDAIQLTHSFNSKRVADPYIGVNLRIAGYSGIEHSRIKEFKKTINEFSKNKLANFKAIPISFHDEDSDVNSISELLDGNVTLNFEDNPDVLKIIEAISQCKILITGSYHAGVFALSMGIPVIAIVGSEYYAQKFVGLKSQFKEGITLVDMSGGNLAQVLHTALEESWFTPVEVSTRLKLRAADQIESSKQLYGSMFSIDK